MVFRRSPELEKQDLKGLVEELRVTGRVVSHGEKQPKDRLRTPLMELK